MIEVRVAPDGFDPGRELERLEALGGGGVASFTGLVRGEGGLIALEIEHFPGMTAKVLEDAARAAAARWALLGTIVVHRYGALACGERIVFVGTAARHRHAALESCAFLIDGLKTSAPFWKCERFSDGTARWVEPRAADEAAARRWG